MLIRDPNHSFYREPGQDPSIVKTVEKMPKEKTVWEAMELPVRTAHDVIGGIINEPGEKAEWIYFIQNTLMASRNMLELRKEIINKAYFMDPILRNILAMRAMKYYKYMSKSFINFHVDLEKAMNRGGKYFKRAPRKNGKGFNYYYSEDDYNKSPSAHVNGEDANNSYLANKVQNILVASKGGDASLFKNLVKKYGVKKIENVLKKEIEKGTVVFKGKKFSWVDKDDVFDR